MLKEKVQEHSGFHFTPAKDDLNITLVDGSESSGIIRLKYKNESRYICANGWSKQDARVACRELGYNGQ